MVFCSKCGFENKDSNEKCDKCGEFLTKKEFLSTKTISDFDDIFSDENFALIDTLTVEAYDMIVTNIAEMGHHNLKKYYQSENPKMHMNIFDKILAITLAYSKISYKSSGAELGSYSFNSIRVDDRLDTASQISTLIHELSHHLFSEIFEQILMYLWGCRKSDEIEALAWFILIGNPLTQLSNEYCAHTCEGRFIPHGYQNYGSFNKILTEEFEPEKDDKAVSVGLVFGNTIAQDIIGILEEFIDYDMREEIKKQYKKDYKYPPRYDQILLETDAIVDDEEKIESVCSILKAGFEASKDKEMKDILDTFRESFTEVNKD